MVDRPPRFEETWTRFLAGPTTLGPSPGAREAWHRGRRWYAAWVLRVDEPAALARMEVAAALLDGLARPVPRTDAHVTVWVAGFPSERCTLDDDIPRAVLDEQARSVESARVPAPRLVLGGLNAFLTCAFLEVWEVDGRLDTIRSMLGQREIRFAPWLPHLTVGTFPETVPTGPIAARIGPLRDLPPIALRPRALELVEFEAAHPMSPLHTRIQIPFDTMEAACACS